MRTLSALCLVFLLPLLSLGQEQADAEKIRAKLRALDEARQAGILSEEEYLKKKALLEAQLKPAAPKLDEATKKKLEALEAARKAGILSEAEYRRKRAELLGQKRPPAATPTKPQQGAQLSAYKDPQGRFLFAYPKGWKVNPIADGRGVNLARGTATVAILEWTGATRGEDVVNSLVQQIQKQWKEFKLLSRGRCKLSGQDELLIEFAGVNPQGARAHGMVAASAAGEKCYSLTRIGPDAEYAALEPVWRVVSSTLKIKQAPKKGNSYSHPMGFNLWHPAEWTVVEKSDFLQLVPPNPGSNDRGATEVYFVIGDTVGGEGIQSPSDPRVISYLDTFVKQNLAQQLQRVGEVGSIGSAKGSGAIVTWQMSNGQGTVVIARTYVTIVKDFGVSLLAFGLKDLIESRDADVRRIFGSFDFGKGKTDPALVGVWKLSHMTDIYNPWWGDDESRVRGSNKEDTTLTLKADGTFEQIYTWELFMMGGGVNAITGAQTMLDSGPQREVTRGTWRADGKVIFFLTDKHRWDDKKYELVRSKQGVRLRMQGDKKKEVWTRQ